MAITILDHMTGSGTIAGRTPDTTDTPGTVWSNLGSTYQGSWSVGSGVAAIVSPGSYLGGQTVAAIDAQQADVTLQCDITFTGASWDAGVVFNFQDGQNYWYAETNNSVPNTITLYEQTAGSFTVRATGTVTIATGNTYKFKVVTAGDAITVYVNNASIISYSVGSRPHKTQTSHGIACYADLGTTWDNFQIGFGVSNLYIGAVQPGALAGTLILDNFVGTNGTDLTAHTISPTNTPATSWTNGLGGANAYTIQSNRAVAFNSNNMVDLVDAGSGDVTITCTVRAISGTAEAGITFRFQDSSNYWYVTGYAGDGKSYLYKVSGGSPASQTSGGSGVTSGVDFTLQVILTGPQITVRINGTTAYTWRDPAFSTATKHGLNNNSADNNQFDDFQVVPAVVSGLWIGAVQPAIVITSPASGVFIWLIGPNVTLPGNLWKIHP